jgi:hypothetical protein
MPDTLTSVTRFSLVPEQLPSPVRSELTLDGAPTGRRVPGIQLLAQYSFGDRFLLLLDEDCPYEGYLYILLLGPSLATIEQRELGLVWGAPGFVADLGVDAPNALEFTFFGNDRWRLAVLAAPRLIWADWNRPPTRQWRKLLARRWLALDQIA